MAFLCVWCTKARSRGPKITANRVCGNESYYISKTLRRYWGKDEVDEYVLFDIIKKGKLT